MESTCYHQTVFVSLYVLSLIADLENVTVICFNHGSFDYCIGQVLNLAKQNLNVCSETVCIPQLIMEQPLEKKSGVRYGPPGSRRMVYFIDDMNMPFVDKYDTQSAIELARQFVDYRGW